MDIQRTLLSGMDIILDTTEQSINIDGVIDGFIKNLCVNVDELWLFMAGSKGSFSFNSVVLV